MSSLKSFIKAVRAAKTMADERRVIQCESAAIRASFREDSASTHVRRKNVAKLLYLFTLGERTHFGQIECVKLLASPKFVDKRLGYLGTMLLLDENQEVLTLVTNSINNDLNHPNQYVVALALTTLGNIASQEMARDLFQDVAKLIGASNPYLKKKAALCAMRISRKDADLQDYFVDKAKLLLNDRNHGVILCGLTLVCDLCENDTNLISQFIPHIPVLVQQLKGLSSSGYSPEHDVSGISDPFLQTKILRLMGILARDNSSAADQMNDIIAQVATNTDSSKNVGNAILYETVNTILTIQADSSLRVLGVNILGKFLANKDNNIRYVALNALAKVVELEPQAVQRHRNTILACLQDADISIRRRALDLSFALINEQTVRALVRELLAFLETADTEFKSRMTTQLWIAAEKFAPNRRWHVDTALRILTLAGNYIQDDVLAGFIILIANTPDLQLYTTEKLYNALIDDQSQDGLTLAACWVIGEYGDLLIKNGVASSDIVDLFDKILTTSYANQVVVKEYILNALIKLTSRIDSARDIERIRRIFQFYSRAIEPEVQQRAVEYNGLFAFPQLESKVTERMPKPELRKIFSVESKFTRNVKGNNNARTRGGGGGGGDLLLDLLSEPTSSPSPTLPEAGGNSADLLSDIFNGGGSTLQKQQQSSSTPPVKGSDSILDLFNNDKSTSDDNQHDNNKFAPVSAFKESLELTLEPIQVSTGVVNVIARFIKIGNNKSSIKNINLQAAVPKSQKLTMQPISGDELTNLKKQQEQILEINASSGSHIRLRLRLSFQIDNGKDIRQQIDFNKFPSDFVVL